jgi:hypothetical protein
MYNCKDLTSELVAVSRPLLVHIASDDIEDRASLEAPVHRQYIRLTKGLVFYPARSCVYL